MTPDETLTAAADRIERVARAATPGPWRAAEQTHGEWTGIQSQFAALGHMHGAADAEHIALWSPDVALLLVPILRDHADWVDHEPCCGPLCVGLACWTCLGTGHPHEPRDPDPHLFALAERVNSQNGDQA